MKTYIILINFTQQGIQNVKESPMRLESAKKAFKAFGGELKEWFLVMGQYDQVVVAEMPDDEALTKVALAIGALGNVRTETMRAFTDEEYNKLIAGLP